MSDAPRARERDRARAEGADRGRTGGAAVPRLPRRRGRAADRPDRRGARRALGRARRARPTCGSTGTRRSPACTRRSRWSATSARWSTTASPATAPSSTSERVHGRRHLRDGDMIRFGQHLVLYRVPGEERAEATVIAAEVSGGRDGLAGPAQGPARPLPSISRTAAASPRRRPTSRSATSCTSASTRSRPTCGRCSRSSGSGTCRRTRSGSALVERALQSGLVSERDL